MTNSDIKKRQIKYLFIISIICLFVTSHGLSMQENGVDSFQSKNQGGPQTENKYNFSADLFSPNIPIWEKFLTSYKGKPNLHYLEVGVFEGRSVIWMLENILTHPTTRITCIDIFPRNVKEIFLGNITKSGFKDKVTTIVGPSQTELRNLPVNTFDIIYIDGSHTADDVLADAILSWPLLKNDGLIILDDYTLWNELYPAELTPMVAIDAFITTYRNYIKIVHRKRQVMIKKLNPFVPHKLFTPLGDYVYSWNHKKLFHQETKKAVELSDKEKQILERFIKSRKFGEIDFSPDIEILNDENFVRLLKRLNLKLNLE